MRLAAVMLLLCAGLAPARADATDELTQAIDQRYSHRDTRLVDWPRLFKSYVPKLKAAPTPAAFAQIAGQLLANATDIHVTIQVDGRTLQPFHGEARGNYELSLVASLIPGVKSGPSCVSAGRSSDGIGYLLIGAWSEACALFANRALDQLAGVPSLVVDVRPNRGGDERLAAQFAGRFLEKEALYALVDTRAAGAFSEKQPRLLAPSAAAHFRGRVAVLMGPACAGGNEAFLLMMRATGARLIGGRSFGSSGNPQPVRLSNGVTISLPSWREYTPGGALIEAAGIAPDMSVYWPDPPEEDVVLRAALETLRHTNRLGR
jgi:C-terminal processing protease CtpA/Prc